MKDAAPRARRPSSHAQLVREGELLISYLCDRPATSESALRYAEALQSLGVEIEPWALPAFVQRWPRCLALLERSALVSQPDATSSGPECWSLEKRLGLAFCIAESDPALAPAFLRTRSTGPVRAAVGLCLALCLEPILLLMVRMRAFLHGSSRAQRQEEVR